MKKCLVLLLIGFLFLGLALSVLAAGPYLALVKTGDAGGVLWTGRNVQENMKSSVPGEPLAVKLGAAIGPDGMAASFLRKLIGGVCGFLILYTRLGFALLETGSRARNTSLPMAVNIVICSIGMLGYRVIAHGQALKNKLKGGPLWPGK